MCGPNLRALHVKIISLFIQRKLLSTCYLPSRYCLGIGEIAINDSHILGQMITIIIVIDVCMERCGKMQSNIFINIAV